MATIAPGNNIASFLMGGIPYPKGDVAEVVDHNTAVRVHHRYGSTLVPMAGSTIGGKTYESSDDIAEFFDALVSLAVNSQAAKVFNLISEASVNENLVAAGPATIMSIVAFNPDDTDPVYLKLYDLAAAEDLDQETPLAVYAVAAGTQLVLTDQLDFNAGIALSITGAPEDDDDTAVGAGNLVLAINYRQ